METMASKATSSPMPSETVSSTKPPETTQGCTKNGILKDAERRIGAEHVVTREHSELELASGCHGQLDKPSSALQLLDKTQPGGYHSKIASSLTPGAVREGGGRPESPLSLYESCDSTHVHLEAQAVDRGLVEEKRHLEERVEALENAIQTATPVSSVVTKETNSILEGPFAKICCVCFTLISITAIVVGVVVRVRVKALGNDISSYLPNPTVSPTLSPTISR